MKMIKEDQKTATCKNGQDEDNKKLLSLLVEEPISVDVGQEERDNIGLGDKIADKITMMIGSWLFIFNFNSLFNYVGGFKFMRI